VRDPKRIDEMLQVLGDLWRRHPDLRLGQIVVMAAGPFEPCPKVFFLEDDAMLRGLRNLCETER